MYSERLLEHFQNPRNVGELEAPAVSVEVSNPACGDIMRLSALLEGDTISAAGYLTRGCTASVAAGSALTEWMQGRRVDDLKSLDTATVESELGGLSRESRHAAVLCRDAVRALLRAWSDSQLVPK